VPETPLTPSAGHEVAGVIPTPDRLLDGRLKLRHLVLLTAIADAGSIARAADSLHVTQPVVTRGLQDLEKILGVLLFERSAQGVTPTIFGAAFLDSARAILAQVRQAGRTLAEIAAADSGTITVGTHLAGSSVVLPRAISLMKRQHPGVLLTVREATPDALEIELLNGDIDLILGRLTTRDARLHTERLYVEPIVLVARTTHPLFELRNDTDETPLTLTTLAQWPWIVPVTTTMLRRELESVFAASGAPWPTDRVECTNVPTMRRLLHEGDFIAAVPASSVDDDPDLRVIEPVANAPAFTHLHRPVGVTTVAERWVPPAVDTFIACLREVVEA
jgi:DNA-binding transcriptional LysR family regulator